MITDTKPGTGPEATSGRTVEVHYTGWLFDPPRPATRAASSTAPATAATPSASASAPAR